LSDEKHIPKLDPDQWVKEHGDYLFSFAISRISSREVAEDLVQETMMSAFQAKEKFRGDSSERTWLISILKRKVIDHYRKQSRNPEVLSDTTSFFYTGGSQAGSWDKEHAPTSWDQYRIDDEDEEGLLKVIQYCISLLPGKMQNTFSMKTLDEISTEEICKELGISESNLWVLLHRARLQLRECVERQWYKKQ